MKPSARRPPDTAGPRMARDIRLARAGPRNRVARWRGRHRTETAPDLIVRGCGLRGERIVYPLVGCLLGAVDATGVDLEQDVDTVPRPPGDLGGGNPGVEPERHPGVTQIVRPRAGLQGDHRVRVRACD